MVPNLSCSREVPPRIGQTRQAASSPISHLWLFVFVSWDPVLLQVLLSNKGYIDAPFHLVPPSSAQGRCFSFIPSEGTVPPGSCHAMVVSFSSGILGMFSEEILFAVEGNSQPISLTFRSIVSLSFSSLLCSGLEFWLD